MKELHANITEAMDHAVATILDATRVVEYRREPPYTLVRYQDGRRTILEDIRYPGEPAGRPAYLYAQLCLEMPPLSPETDFEFMAQSLGRQVDELTERLRNMEIALPVIQAVAAERRP